MPYPHAPPPYPHRFSEPERIHMSQHVSRETQAEKDTFDVELYRNLITGLVILTAIMILTFLGVTTYHLVARNFLWSVFSLILMLVPCAILVTFTMSTEDLMRYEDQDEDQS